MNRFTRTPSGIVGSRFFYREPIVWVEGPTDIYFYEPILGDLKYKLKYFSGAPNAAALIAELCRREDSTYPYAVILDGDYGFLEGRRSPHRWVITLRRYSFENYFWEEMSLNKSCLKHAQCGEHKDAIGTFLKQAELEIKELLMELVAIDMAARMMDPSPKILPDRVEPLLKRPDSAEICGDKVKRLLENVQSIIDEKFLRKAKEKIDRHLKAGGRLVEILNGHILFGLLQRVFTQASTSVRGRKVVVPDDVLTQLLAEMLWRVVPTYEHKRLRLKVIKVVREMNSVAAIE